MRHARLTTFAVALVAAVWMAMPQLAARQAAPGAPSGLSYVVGPGGSLQLLWTHATGTFTHYNIEAAAGPGRAALPGPADLEFRQSRSVLEAPRAAQLVQRQRHRPGRLLRAHPRRQRRRGLERRQQRDPAAGAQRLLPAGRAHQLRGDRARHQRLPAVEPGQRRPADRAISCAPASARTIRIRRCSCRSAHSVQPRHSAGQLLRARRGGERLRHERAVERDRGHRPGQHARARRRTRRRASGCRSPTCATWCSSTPPRRAHSAT